MVLGIIDYGDSKSGSGNINSIKNYIDYHGYEFMTINYPEQMKKVDKILLPGVGATKHVMQNLISKNFVEALNQSVIKEGVPFLGICAGMQVLAGELNEFGKHKGLGWIDGDVVNIKNILNDKKLVPNMGWTSVNFQDNNIDLKEVFKKNNNFYFAHSYTLIPKNKKIINSLFSYGKKLVAGINFENIVAFQFHPEKSQFSGSLLLNWFMNWKP